MAAGTLGSLAGGWLADWALRRTSRAYFLVSGLGFVAGLPLIAVALALPGLWPAATAMFFAEFFLFLNMGPINAIIVAVTDLRAHSMAFAANILVIHALGDAFSPTMIGAASDLWGGGQAGLTKALLAASALLAPAAAFCFLGMRHYDADTERISHA